VCRFVKSVLFEVILPLTRESGRPPNLHEVLRELDLLPPSRSLPLAPLFPPPPGHVSSSLTPLDPRAAAAGRLDSLAQPVVLSASEQRGKMSEHIADSAV